VADGEKVPVERSQGTILIMKLFILATLVIFQACAGEQHDSAQGAETDVLAYSVTDTIAGMGKSGTYIARGSFTGGEITDGRDVHRIEWSMHDGFERLEIRIHEAKWGDSDNADPVQVPCRFTVRREDFPARLLVSLGGTRMFSAPPPELPADRLTRGYYRIVYLGDSGAMFVFDVENDTEFEVYEMHDPAVIVIDIREVPAGSRSGPETVFSLRSVSWQAGEGPGHFQERLMKAGTENSRIIRDAGGGFCVEEGWYTTRDEAEKKQKLLAGKDFLLFIEQRGIDGRIRHISPEQK